YLRDGRPGRVPLSRGLALTPRAGAPRGTWRTPDTGLVPPSRHAARGAWRLCGRDRKSTRLNSSHLVISYAVFCLKKKNISKPAPDERAKHRKPLLLIQRVSF